MVSWDQRFFDPILLPGGDKLVTLRDAGNYIASLAKAEHDAPEWRAAIEALMLVAEHGGDAHQCDARYTGMRRYPRRAGGRRGNIVIVR